jgi:SPP1 family predicted phage head-tail adaptor
MQAGKLRHLVTLQQKSVLRDDYGGEIVTWQDVASVFAEANPWQLRERLVMRQQQGQSVIGFRVRAPLNVSLGKRLLFNGVGYEVVDIDATLEHKGELLITGLAEATTP